MLSGFRFYIEDAAQQIIVGFDDVDIGNDVALFCSPRDAFLKSDNVLKIEPSMASYSFFLSFF
ncbi:MAG TPA: hypothetical protein EYF96_02905 [Nitrospinaceae bacterium]|jgi:hypothetical protein|nr:hypothetical protein [Nitrospinaceae bacterium]